MYVANKISLWGVESWHDNDNDNDKDFLFASTTLQKISINDKGDCDDSNTNAKWRYRERNFGRENKSTCDLNSTTPDLVDEQRINKDDLRQVFIIFVMVENYNLLQCCSKKCV